MTLITQVHRRFLLARRVDRLAQLILPHLPEHASILDIGAGDGRLAASLLSQRPSMMVRGLDVLIRAETAIPITTFDGRSLPLPDSAVDYALLIDVLHHADEPEQLLREALRVASAGVVIKDHLAEGPVDHWTLRLMDWIGNAGHGVRLPYAYLSQRQWKALFNRVGGRIASWDGHLGLYPPPASWMFDRGLHFLALLAPDACHGGCPE